MATIPRTSTNTRPPLQLQHLAANLYYQTNDTCTLATLLEQWGWQRLHPWRREAYRLKRGDSIISIDISGGVVALGPAAVVALHLPAQQEVQS